MAEKNKSETYLYLPNHRIIAEKMTSEGIVGLFNFMGMGIYAVARYDPANPMSLDIRYFSSKKEAKEVYDMYK